MDYYVIEIPKKRMTVRVPIDKIDDLGIRPTMVPAKLDSVFVLLGSEPASLPNDNRKRQDQIRQMLGSGVPLEVAEAVRDLVWRREQSHLTKADSDLLAWGEELLTTEIAIVTNIDVMEAKQQIQSALAGTMPAAAGLQEMALSPDRLPALEQINI
jgi:CarD family transcriptional regulator